MGRQWDGSAEEEHDDSYRPISILGILSFLLGLLCLFSIYFPQLGLVGLVGIILGLLAVVAAQKQPTSLGWMAYLGVFLAVFGITWSQASRSSYEAHILHVASQHGKEWLELIKDGNINEAICLRMEYLDRPLEGTDLDKYFQQSERPSSSHSMMPAPKEMKKLFTEKKTVQNLVISGKNTQIRPVIGKDRITATETGIIKIFTTYEVDVVLGGKPETIELEVEIYRVKFPTHVEWQVRDVSNLTHPDFNINDLVGEDTGGLKE